jgi:hypothetical protein
MPQIIHPLPEQANLAHLLATPSHHSGLLPSSSFSYPFKQKVTSFSVPYLPTPPYSKLYWNHFQKCFQTCVSGIGVNDLSCPIPPLNYEFIPDTGGSHL